MEELTLTDEQLEIKEEQQAKEVLRQNLELGRALEKLKKNPDFKLVIEGTFLKIGKSILWQNIQHLSEEEMKGRGSERNLELIEAIKGQVKSRLDFEGFMDTVEADYEGSLEEVDEAQNV